MTQENTFENNAVLFLTGWNNIFFILNAWIINYINDFELYEI